MSHVLRRDPFADPERLIRRVYAYVAYRIGPGQPAEDATRDVFMRALERRGKERHTDVWLIDTARKDLDERFGASERDRGVAALHLVGLDTAKIAKLLGYRREAAMVALGRALSRLRDAQELASAEADPEFVERLVDDIRAARQPSSRRRRRALAVAVSAAALLAAVPAFGALVAGDDGNQESNAVPKSSAPSPPEGPDCEVLAERLEALPARQERAIARLIRRQAQQRVEFLRRRGRTATNPDSGPRAAKFLRERSAFEARLYREQETLLERLNRELRKLEAQRKSCEG